MGRRQTRRTTRRKQRGGVTLPKSKREILIDKIQENQAKLGESQQLIADYENDLRALGSQLKQAKSANAKSQIRMEMQDQIMNKRFVLSSIKSIRKEIERLEARVKALNAASNAASNAAT